MITRRRLPKFKVTMASFVIEARNRDDAIEQVGEMIMPDPCGLFEFEEVSKHD